MLSFSRLEFTESRSSENVWKQLKLFQVFVKRRVWRIQVSVNGYSIRKNEKNCIRIRIDRLSYPYPYPSWTFCVFVSVSVINSRFTWIFFGARFIKLIFSRHISGLSYAAQKYSITRTKTFFDWKVFIFDVRKSYTIECYITLWQFFQN